MVTKYDRTQLFETWTIYYTLTHTYYILFTFIKLAVTLCWTVLRWGTFYALLFWKILHSFVNYSIPIAIINQQKLRIHSYEFCANPHDSPRDMYIMRWVPNKKWWYVKGYGTIIGIPWLVPMLAGAWFESS